VDALVASDRPPTEPLSPPRALAPELEAAARAAMANLKAWHMAGGGDAEEILGRLRTTDYDLICVLHEMGMQAGFRRLGLSSIYPRPPQ